MKAFILFAVVAVAFAREQCGENEHYTGCGTDCPLTCDNYDNPPKFCNLMCRIGCECDKGYVRSSDGRCVRPEQCPPRTQQYQCGENEHYNSCGTDCPLTCSNYDNPPIACNFMCRIGCECDEGYVRSSDGRCVRPEQCPAKDPECGANQHYTTCGTSCPLTCDNYSNPPKICNLRCNFGCVCDEGFVLTSDGKCIRPFQCPQNVYLPEIETCTDKPDPGVCYASFPMWYYDAEKGECKKFTYGGCHGNGNRYESEERCYKRCQGVKTIKPTNRICTLPAEPGVCRGRFPRYFYDVQTRTCTEFVYGGCGGNENNFETIQECKRICDCGENEHYNSCGTDCPLTCDNYDNPPVSCDYKCRIGCECDKGYVRSSDGRCVRPEECPARLQEQECGPNQHYTTCGTACPLTCDNYANPPKICVLMCKIGCECDEGFVLTREGKCIRSFQCPQNASRPIEQTCTEKPDPGMCLAYFPMWYYDAESGSCKEFVYGGCQGNGNRYRTQEECLNRCQGVKASPSACTLPAETGVCRGRFPRYFYDVQSGTCKHFIYGGCGGNENNFESIEECESTCGIAPRRAPQACLQEKVTGLCKGHFPRFYFNKESGECEEFIYGGCGGNSNNFNSHDGCEAVCKS